MMPHAHELAHLLSAWIAGEPGATETLLPVLRLELAHQADLHAEHETASGHLEPTLLIQETFLRLVRLGALQPGDRERFFAATARLLRRIVVDTAREVEVARHDRPAPLSQPRDPVDSCSIEIDLLALDRAMSRLEDIDRSQAEVVELRFFGGLSMPETAALLGLGIATVERRWHDARCWLLEHLSNEPATRDTPRDPRDPGASTAAQAGSAAAARLARRSGLD